MATTQIFFDTSRVFTYTGKTIAGVTAAAKLGAIYEDSTGKKYKFCVNGHSAAGTAGDFTAYDYNGAGLTLAYGPLAAIAGNTCVVFKPSTATLTNMAGVWCGTPALSSSTQTGAGWVQIQGQTDSALVDGTTDLSIGDSIKMVNATFAAVKDAASGTAATYHSFGIMLVAYTTNAEALKSVMLCCGSIA